MNIENLSTLKIHKLTQEQYDRELVAGNIDETALYLTPDETTVGKNVEGKIFIVNGTEVVAGYGAEVFNGNSNMATGLYSHAEGTYAKAFGYASHAEGEETTASGQASHAEGSYSRAEGDYSHAEGSYSRANGESSHAEGKFSRANGTNSHAEGLGTNASGINQHVQGKYNIEDTSDKYAHIVGNGTIDAPSNAHTIDWDGNAWFAGYVECDSIILKSPNGSSYKITVDDNGNLITEKITIST